MTRLVALAALVAPWPQEPIPAVDSGLERLRADARAVAPLVRTPLARAFVDAAAGAGVTPIRPRTLYYDPARKAYLAGAEVEKLDPAAREAIRAREVGTAFYYGTRYGSPLAYARAIEVLGLGWGEEGRPFETFAGRKVLDFGCGGLGPHRILAMLGADVVAVDVDPMLAALYSEPGDQGEVGKAGGRVSLVLGRYPADAAVKAKVGTGYQLILSKNTLKRGYVHPEAGPASIDLGMSDPEFLATLHAALEPGGRLLIYNLAPAMAAPGEPYKPMADGRCPFSRSDCEAAGFRAVAFDQDDSSAAREMGHALEWDQGPAPMKLESDLFATYTLLVKPPR